MNVLASQGVFPFGRPTMGDSGPGLYKGAGCGHHQAPGAYKPVQARSILQRRRHLQCQSKPKAQRPAKEEGGGRRQRRRNPSRSRRGGGLSESGPEPNPLTQNISLCQWALCLPRWILRSRTKFAFCLASSFAAKRRSAETASAVFPLPLPSLDCFEGSGPRLSKRRLWTLAKTRLLNVWTLVLDFLFLGRWPTLDELRRSPSTEQLLVFDRLWTCLTACGPLGNVSSVPR